MKKKFFVLLMVSVAVLALAGQSFAVPAYLTGSKGPIVDNTQLGSLMVFPKIVVEYDEANALVKDTFIRITNTGDAADSAVDIVCGYLTQDGEKDVWYAGSLRNRASAWFRASDGAGAGGLFGQALPTYGESNLGDLKCWAVGYDDNGDEVERVWNALYGTAKIVDYASDFAPTMWEYSSWNFQAGHTAGTAEGALITTTPGQLQLDGIEYDNCPKFLYGHFIPVGADLGLFEDGTQMFEAVTTDVTLAPCKQDLRQDYEDVITKAQYDVYTKNGNKVGGSSTWVCFQGWLEHSLGRGGSIVFSDSKLGAGSWNISNLPDGIASFRVAGVESTQCPGSKAIGLVGVINQLHETTAGYVGSGTNLQADYRPAVPTGVITYDQSLLMNRR